MKRQLVLLLVSLTIGASGLFAQNISHPAEAKRLYSRIKNNVIAAAEKMPEDNYGFKRIGQPHGPAGPPTFRRKEQACADQFRSPREIAKPLAPRDLSEETKNRRRSE